MQDRYNIFKKVVEHLRTKYGNESRITETEELECHCFYQLTPYEKDLEYLKAELKKRGTYKGPKINEPGKKDENDIFSEGRYLINEAFKTYHTVLYNKIKNKISIGEFRVGVAYNFRGNRYYPLRLNLPLITLSKTLYVFPRIKRLQLCQVYSGQHVPLEYVKLLTEIEYEPEEMVHITYRGLLGSTSPIDAVEKQFGVRIPKIIQKRLHIVDIIKMCKLLTEADFNRVCQVLNQYPAVDVSTMNGSIACILEGIWFKTGRFSNVKIEQNEMWREIGDWLVRDYVYDLLKFRKKASLKITSHKRIEAEHAEYSRRVRAKGIPEFKVKKAYNGLLEGLPYKWELITERKRLLQEGNQQQHCVASYGSNINSGHCAIYSIVFDGKRYTLELKQHSKDAFQIAQLRGLRNCEAPQELHQALSTLKNVYEYNNVPRVHEAQHVDALPF